MRKAKLILLLAAVGLLFSCGGGAGDGIRSALFGNRVLQPQQTCTVTVNTVDALQSALTTAQSNNQNDVICIQAGTYTVTQTLTYSTPNGDGGKTLTIKAVGGQVVLDGGGSVQIMSINTDSDNNGGDAGGHVTIEGITFQNGNISGIGGGLSVKTGLANINLTNNTFSNNRANYNNSANNEYEGGSGGGVCAYSESGDITLTNNTFSNNSANQYGGGADVYLWNDTATGNIYNNIFWQNTANAGGNDGDDLYVESNENNNQTPSTVNLYNNNFSGNANFQTGQSEDLFITLVQPERYNQANNIQADPLFVNASA
ncbi:MAG: hypothetical protein ABDI07_11535, partial [Candidatus Kryptonium sp.]